LAAAAVWGREDFAGTMGRGSGLAIAPAWVKDDFGGTMGLAGGMGVLAGTGFGGSALAVPSL
jgi:hypothetical protein